tara:strand:+ start:383 stop:676 length:294 start_codon:yes stop_codon:yes gene_type:complete
MLPYVNFTNLKSKDFADDVAVLDIVVSTKTAIPLISTEIGKSTKLAHWPQSTWNNVLLNPVGPSIDIFERDTWEPWDNLFNSIAENILKLNEKWRPQ